MLYGDGHVEAYPNPFVGVQRDNIYTVASTNGKLVTTSPASTVPTSANDAIMLPPDD